MRLLLTFMAIAACCAVLLWAAWGALGLVGLACGMPVVALFAKPLLDALERVPGIMNRLALRKVAGRYFEFRGRSIDIHIDAEARCWVCTADTRKIVALPADAVLSRLLPEACGELGDPLRWRMTVEGLLLVLARSSNPDVTKFCNWLETQVARPARNRRDGRTVPG